MRPEARQLEPLNGAGVDQKLLVHLRQICLVGCLNHRTLLSAKPVTTSVLTQVHSSFHDPYRSELTLQELSLQDAAKDTPLPQPRQLDPHPAAKPYSPIEYSMHRAGGAIFDNWIMEPLI
jgi:hypothetical protein